MGCCGIRPGMRRNVDGNMDMILNMCFVVGGQPNFVVWFALGCEGGRELSQRHGGTMSKLSSQ